MSAVVCGKRSSSIFSDEVVPSAPPSPPHHQPSKRSRFSPTRAFDDAAAHRREALLHHLLSLFPHMDPQLLERALEASGDDLESTIKSLKDLCLESAETVLPVAVCESENVMSTTFEISAEENCQKSYQQSSEWVDLFVREIMSSNINDARACALRALEAFEKIIMERTVAEAEQKLHKENVMLKEQLAMTLRENTALKRGIAIQHERQKEFDEMTQEANNLKQLVSQYQGQIRTLEINNYALRVHLEQAQHHNSMPGRSPPDVF